MRIEAQAGALNNAMAMAAMAAAKNASGVHIIAAEGRISFACCGQGIAIRSKISDANISAAGEATVSANRLSELLAGFPKGDAITFDSKDNALAIRCGRSRYQLPQDLDPPEMLSIGGDGVQLKMPDADLLYLFDVVAAAGSERTRFNLHGTCLQTMGGKLTATSTDGERLLSASVAADEFSDDRHCIVPSRSVATVCKLVRAHKSKMLTLHQTRNLFAVSAPAFEFTTQMIGAVFPDWTRVVPAAGSNFVSCAKRDLSAALVRLAAVADGESSLALVALSWDADPSLRVFLPRQPGSGEDFIAAEITGHARIALSLPKLQAMIDNFNCDRIQLEVSQDDVPLILRGQGDKLGVLTSCRWPRDFSGAQP
jgi:DNA polymerase-3 subunit beta